MPHDPRRVAEVREWLTKARDDLVGARTLVNSSPPLAGLAAFHSQQAAEKSLKAFLTWHDVPFRKTHDLEEIGRASVALEPALGNVAEEAAGLTPFAWRFRYPGGPSDLSPEEAKEAIALARKLYDAILAYLPAEVRP